ncbi:MAG: DUF3467 domain-containing protein [Pseudopedobacter saltans]|uniref:DUF3467 domain-containing protein n=1 Tax=Pseudopedobacter saltans TaxID=151895 RepID=A0A2W5F4E1_9SPHI|nr:MAG: DUF3467 domain-containing protein [Pseudopedobacter saltans]
MQQEPKDGQLNIEITEEIGEGSYSNLVIITHSQAEFILDFVNIMPGLPKSKVKSRVIMSPIHAKRFLEALADNVKNYEKENGQIKEANADLIMNFGGPTAQA